VGRDKTFLLPRPMRTAAPLNAGAAWDGPQYESYAALLRQSIAVNYCSFCPARPLQAPAYPRRVDFEVEHAFPHPVEAVAGALLDEDFQESLTDIGALESRTLLSQEERSDGSVVRRVRCVLDIDLKGPARRFIGDSDPAWVEEAVWDPEARLWRWSIEPEVARHLLDARGEIAIEDDDDKSIRRVLGFVKVNVPFYGGKVEGWIVEGIEQAYDEEAERLADWLGT
jgi:hypothetical protein